MLDSVKDAVNGNSKEIARWGIGAILGMTILGFFLYEGRADKEYMRTKFTDTQTQLATSLDALTDATQAGTAVSKMMVTEFKALAKETDDVGDEMRAQVKQIGRLVDVIEANHQTYAKPITE